MCCTFYNCSKLINFEIEDVTGLCQWGSTTYGTPLKCNTLEKHLFIGGVETTSVTIPSSVTSIEKGAFYNCSSLKSITFKGCVENIGSDAFDGCSALNTFTYPNLEVWFNQCKTAAGNPNKIINKGMHLVIGEEEIMALTEENLTGYTELCSDAFYNCAFITDAVIPSYITSIGSNVFTGCSALKEILVQPTTPPALANSNSFPLHISLIIDADRFEAYTTADVWKDLTLTHQLVPCTENNERNLTVEAEPTMSVLHKAIGDQYAGEVLKLKVKGSINSYDIMFINTKMYSLRELDLSEASIVYNEYEYKAGYHSNDNQIDGYAFANMPLLATIKLPENITSIGEYAFYQSGIREITIPASVTEIGKYAFNNCNDLLRFNYESSSTAHIGQYALVGSVLSDVFISGTDITIDGYAISLSADSRLKMAAQNIRFENNACSKVKELDLTAPSVYFGNNSCNTTDLTTVTGDFAATYIGENAFSTIPSLTITGDNCRLCKSAFGGTASVKLRGTFSSFDANCLSWSLTLLDISEVTAIKKIETFGVSCGVSELIFPDFTEEVTLSRCSFDCPNLTKLRLPGGLVTIPGADKFPPFDTFTKEFQVSDLYSFYSNYYPVVKCPNLITLIIPSTVKEIGALAPKYDYRVYCKAEKERYTIEQEGPSELIFEDGIALGTLAFQKFGVTTGTFESCTKLTCVHFGEGVKVESLDDSTFKGCNRLKEFTVGEGSTIDKIGASAFSGCRSLKTMNLPQNVKSVFNNAFESCSSLEAILLGDELQTIGNNAFSGCSSLKSFNLGKSLTSIGASAFKGCKALANLTIPSKVSSIGVSAFEGCTSLTEMILSPGVTEVGNRMMYGCTGLQTLSMPSSVKKIGTDAFNGCVGLTEFKIPSGLESIGTGAFAGCTGMTDVYSYTLEPTEITETTFPNMSATLLHVPQQAYYTYYYREPWTNFLHISTFLEPFDYFYLNGDMKLDRETGVIEGEPDAELNAGGGLILKDQIGQKLGDVHLKNDGTISASLLYDASTEIVEGARLYQEIDVKANQWYFFCFPFDALREDVTSPGSYIFRYYDSQERAQNGTGNSWKKLAPLAEEPWLHAGMGYIYQTNTAGTLTVPVNQPDFTNVNRAQDLQVYNAANTANASWNFTGNVTPGYYEIGDMQYDAPITIWDGKTYVAYRPGDDVYLLSPYQAFFVQRPVNAESLQFAEDARLTYTQGQKAVQAKQARRRAAAQRLDRLVFDMVLSLDSLSDRTRVVYNDMATTAYDLDHDASKFFSMDASMPQFYSLDVQQECYAINERPTADGRVRLGYYAPQAGTYTIRAERLDAFCKLYDRVTGRIIDLDLDEYTFQSEAGTFDDRFEFRCSADVNGIALIQQQTGVKLQGGEGQIVLQGASADKPVHIYNVAGDLVTVAEEDGAISLPKGAYVVAIGRVSTKVMVK